MQVLSTFKARSICRLIVAETPVQQQCLVSVLAGAMVFLRSLQSTLNAIDSGKRHVNILI
jgi:hypothetical protein